MSPYNASHVTEPGIVAAEFNNPDFWRKHAPCIFPLPITVNIKNQMGKLSTIVEHTKLTACSSDTALEEEAFDGQTCTNAEVQTDSSLTCAALAHTVTCSNLLMAVATSTQAC
eukprot:SM000047S16854  [mRNA]  locus=s47:323053:323769:+ [translate_table: standard]